MKFRRLLSIVVLAFAAFALVGCGEEEKEAVFKADGTYMAYSLGTQNTNLLDFEGNPLKDSEDKNIKVNAPTITTVTVEIENDEVKSFYIDELQSKPYAKNRSGDTTVDENGNVTGVVWEFNEKTKKELKEDYNMADPEKGNKEWYQQAKELEDFWLTNSPEDYTVKTADDGVHAKDEKVAGVTIQVKGYEKLAKEALQNAKDGKITAVVPYEHYTYDVTIVEASVNAEGKISDVALDAIMFGGFDAEGLADAEVYNPESDKYLQFAWNTKTKYESYPEMDHDDEVEGPKWQDSIDALNEYIEENGWDGSIVAGDNGKIEGNEALASVSVQVHHEIELMNMLLEWFPKGWE